MNNSYYFYIIEKNIGYRKMFNNFIKLVRSNTRFDGEKETNVAFSSYVTNRNHGFIKWKSNDRYTTQYTNTL